MKPFLNFIVIVLSLSSTSFAFAEVLPGSSVRSRPKQRLYMQALDIGKAACHRLWDQIQLRLIGAEKNLATETGTLQLHTYFSEGFTTPEPPCTEDYTTYGCGGTSYHPSECRMEFVSRSPSILFREVRTEKIFGKNRNEACLASEPAIEAGAGNVYWSIENGGGFPTFRKPHCRHFLIEVGRF